MAGRRRRRGRRPGVRLKWATVSNTMPLAAPIAV
jgi:hypothetical protein